MFRTACIIIAIHHVTAFSPSQLHNDSNQGLHKDYFIDEIMDRIKRLEISSIKDREIIEDLKASSDKYRARINVLEHAAPSRTMRVAEPKPGTNGVAFSASMTTMMQTPRSGDVIIFGSVMTNIGLSYDSASGVFTCPQNGTYFISWSFRVSRHFGSAVLNKNGNDVAEAKTGDDNSYNEEGSGSSVLQLQQGDRLTIRVGNYPTPINYLPPASFSGFSIL